MHTHIYIYIYIYIFIYIYIHTYGAGQGKRGGRAGGRADTCISFKFSLQTLETALAKNTFWSSLIPGSAALLTGRRPPQYDLGGGGYLVSSETLDAPQHAGFNPSAGCFGY